MSTETTTNEAALPPVPCSAGRDALWHAFGLSYAAWLTLPRSMMHQMPDEWQGKMAALLDEWDATWVNQPALEARVQCTRNGKLIPMPTWIENYRHPDVSVFDAMKQNSSEQAHAANNSGDS